jgi:dTDP-4-amino-4,6-dideoxygalactose transaminase
MQLPIHFIDLKKQSQQIKTEVLDKIAEVCEQAAFSGGKYVEDFELAFAKYCQTPYSIALNNGTSALHLALLAAGIGEGDEVLVPANTYIATAFAVSYTKAKPVFIDCKSDTWEIDASKIEEKINPKTKAIIGVHLYGQSFDVDKVKAIADTYRLLLIEDAAQAHGAIYKGRTVGGLGKLACFSFYPSKNLGTYGEAGGITTYDEELAERIKSLRNHGSIHRYLHEELGYNMRMGGLEAAVLLVKLKYLDSWNQRRKAIARLYHTYLQNPIIRYQYQPDYTESVYHLFVIICPERERLLQYLNNHQIFPGMHYPVPCHLQKAYRELGYREGDCPEAEYLAKHCLSLPMYPELTDEEVMYVIDCLNKFGV